MATIGEGFKNIFLAGIGAMAMTGEKSKELIDQLVEKGELTMEQGKQLNTELQHKASEAAKSVRDSTLEARMSVMTPEEREAFVARATEIAAEQNAKDAEKAKEQVEAQVEVVADAVEEQPADEQPAADEAQAQSETTAE